MPADDADDPAFVARLKRRDEAAFNELVRRWESPIFHMVLRLVGNRAEAEELAQEVFVTVFKSIDGFRGDSKLSTWIYRIAVNHTKNRLKYLGRRATSAHRAHEDTRDQERSGEMPTHATVPGPEAHAVGAEAERLVRRALEALEEEHRTLILLRDVEGLSYEEIRAVTGLAEGTVKSRLHRARAALERAYRALGGGEPGRGSEP